MSIKYSRIMTAIEQKCNQCSATFQIAEDYSAPFVKCPECGSMQRYNKLEDPDKPKYKISNKTGGLKSVKMPVKIIDDSKVYEEMIGADGLVDVCKQVATYMSNTSIPKRRSLKSKILQKLMQKYKLTSDVASHMLDFAEKFDVTHEIMENKSRNSKLAMVIIGILIVAAAIGGVLTFL